MPDDDNDDDDRNRFINLSCHCSRHFGAQCVDVSARRSRVANVTRFSIDGNSDLFARFVGDNIVDSDHSLLLDDDSVVDCSFDLRRCRSWRCKVVI